LLTGINDQLIKKYLSTNVEYGIYLVFCFSETIDLVQMTANLKNTIPAQYSKNIDVILIDLRLKEITSNKQNKKNNRGKR
jgi:hypothetical protein